MNLFPSLFHHSGGLVYHWRAVRNLNQLWSAHLDHTRNFLEEWAPRSKTLNLIGPSGGYSLPKEWLARFKRILAFEPDPVARKIFEVRNRIRPEWIKKPFDFQELHSGNIHFEEDSAILFCNLLGQFHFEEEAGLLAQSELLKLALRHEFASYHDVLSGDHFRFEWSTPTMGDEPVRAKFDVEAMDPYITPDEGLTELNLHIHPSNYLFQDDEPFRYQYWEWRITPTQTQVIEGVFSRNP
jgi:hypothetical protein